MTSAARLLTAVSFTTVFKRNIHIALSNRDIKFRHMTTTIPLKHLLIKNIRKQTSAPEALLSTYIDLQDSNVSKKTRKEFRKRIMEPYLNTCYGVHSHHNSNVDDDVVKKMDKSSAKQNYKAMRKWKTVGRGLRGVDPEENCTVRLFSYNILAQHLIEMHRYLYKHHNQQTLNWDVRRESLIQEIMEAEATVICLQEMQQQHLKDFVKPFEENGYKYLYKKRTNDKEDGLLMMYRSDTFNLLEYTNVEFFQTGIELLSRDNVAIIAKLSFKDSPQTKLVVATTHLLYNPKRNDIRLGQTQILLAELERMAFIENTTRGPKYHPMIIAGDFNLKPFSGVYDFITQGSFQYVGKSRTLGPPDHRRLSNSLIPPHLHVTDGCQHYHVLVKRLSNRGEGQVMLENSEKKTPSDKVCEKSTRDQFKKVEVDVGTPRYQQIQMGEGLHVTFGSGCLTHPFNLRSVYSHKDCNGQNEVTTHQDEWTTVDYVFYSDVKLVEKYALPTKKQCKALARIPNLAVGSDHLSLGATFVIKKKKGP